MPNSVSENIHKLRQKKGISQDRLSKEAILRSILSLKLKPEKIPTRPLRRWRSSPKLSVSRWRIYSNNYETRNAKKTSTKKPHHHRNEDNILRLKKRLIKLDKPVSFEEIENKTIHQDVFEALDYLPDKFIDLVFVDPPYNLNKTFNLTSFKAMESAKYEEWLNSWIQKMIRLLKPHASIYICGDWKSSGAIFNVANKYFQIQNRITFEREKGRGAKSNWKNCSEDIWFCTFSKNYHFDVDAVKMKRKVIAPYRDENGKPKDWEGNGDEKYRITHPSNIWTDITIPFWSMPENTDHPTQKPEKLVAKIILASSKPNDVVFDPFLGSGTTSVVAEKLGRRYVA